MAEPEEAVERNAQGKIKQKVSSAFCSTNSVSFTKLKLLLSVCACELVSRDYIVA